MSLVNIILITLLGDIKPWKSRPPHDFHMNKKDSEFMLMYLNKILQTKNRIKLAML